MARADLIALTDEGLVQLSNAGLVRRALREFAAGAGPVLAEGDDGAIEARFADGTLTRLLPGQGLADAACSCPSSGICRHRIMLAVAYRAERAEAQNDADMPRWSPAALDSEAFEQGLSPSIRAEIRRLLAARHPIRLEYGRTPSAHLPMASVRFLVPDDLSYARCDCVLGRDCAHVALAIRAFRGAQGATETMLGGEAGGDAAPAAVDRHGLCDAGEAVIAGLADAGVAAGPQAHARALAALRKHAEALGAAQILLAVDALAEQIEAYEKRSARYDERMVLRLAAELFARPRAGDAVTALGLGEVFETAMGKTRLVSLGARLRQEGADIRASILLADSDMGATVLVEKLFSPLPAEAQPLHATIGRRQLAPGLPVSGLGRGQILTSVARRRADGLLMLGSGRAGRTQVMSRDASFAFASPLAASSVEAVTETLANRPIALLRPRRQYDAVHIFDIEAVLGHAWAPGRQVWEAGVRVTGSGTVLHLERAFDAAAPGATRILAAALEGRWGALRQVAGPVRLEGGALVCEPWSLSADRFVVPDLDEGDDGDDPVTPLSVEPVPDLLDESERLLSGLLHGGSRARNAADALLPALCARLSQAGYAKMSALVAAIATSAPGDVEAFCRAAVWLLTLRESREANAGAG